MTEREFKQWQEAKPAAQELVWARHYDDVCNFERARHHAERAIELLRGVHHNPHATAIRAKAREILTCIIGTPQHARYMREARKLAQKSA